MDNENKLFGVAALFDTPDQIIKAAREASAAGFTKFDVNTPYPVHGMDRAMKLKPTKLGFVTLFFGFSGAFFILLFMFWAMSQNYPMIVGGKPFFALPAFIPITFETAVLLGAIATVFGMIAAFFNLPFNDHPLHDTEYMKAVSSDKYGLVIEADDKLFNRERVLSLFRDLDASFVEDVFYPEKIAIPIFSRKFIISLIVIAVITSLSTYLFLNKILYITPFDWMMEQEKELPQKKSTFFADDFGMRKPVAGTVAKGFLPYPYMGQTNPKEVLSNPILPSKNIIELGKRKFNTFCSPCHGTYADGDSRLRGQFPNPPSLHTTRVRDFADGMIYHIMTNGQNAMPSYAQQITREERWSIVHYLRVLQRAKNAKPEDIKALSKETVTNGTR